MANDTQETVAKVKTNKGNGTLLFILIPIVVTVIIIIVVVLVIFLLMRRRRKIRNMQICEEGDGDATTRSNASGMSRYSPFSSMRSRRQSGKSQKGSIGGFNAEDPTGESPYKKSRGSLFSKKGVSDPNLDKTTSDTTRASTRHDKFLSMGTFRHSAKEAARGGKAGVGGKNADANVEGLGWNVAKKDSADMDTIGDGVTPAGTPGAAGVAAGAAAGRRGSDGRDGTDRQRTQQGGLPAGVAGGAAVAAGGAAGRKGRKGDKDFDATDRQRTQERAGIGGGGFAAAAAIGDKKGDKEFNDTNRARTGSLGRDKNDRRDRDNTHQDRTTHMDKKSRKKKGSDEGLGDPDRGNTERVTARGGLKRGSGAGSPGLNTQSMGTDQDVKSDVLGSRKGGKGSETIHRGGSDKNRSRTLRRKGSAGQSNDGDADASHGSQHVWTGLRGKKNRSRRIGVGGGPSSPFVSDFKKKKQET